MNPRPLGPEPSALPSALHPDKKAAASALLRWLGMRESNSHKRSQSPSHYHYANPHCMVKRHRFLRLPSTLSYYSVSRGICQHLFLLFYSFSAWGAVPRADRAGAPRAERPAPLPMSPTPGRLTKNKQVKTALKRGISAHFSGFMQSKTDGSA